MKKEFIKVTPKGGKKSFIVPAAIEAFYRSQKATIERPTDDEIAAERPEVRAQYKAAKRAKAITDEVNALRKENADLKALINALKAGKPSKKAK